MGVERIAFQGVLGVKGDIVAGFVLAQNVDTTAIGGYPDVAFTILYSLVGCIGTE